MDHSSTYHFSRERIEREGDLIRAAKKDPSAFAPLYKSYHEKIFLFILKRVESEDIASDITSQVFLKAMSKLAKYEERGLPFGSWLYRIARNEIYDMFNDKKIELVVSVESRGMSDMIGEIGATEKQDHEALYMALGSLSDEDMELVELRFFEQRAFKEIGEILEITENNAKVKTYRILDKLKKRLMNER